MMVEGDDMDMPFAEGIDVPRAVATCPYCDASLFVQANGWDLEPTRWEVATAQVDCTAEPDIDTDEWNDWWNAHRHMPYVYQLPVDEKVMRWLRTSASDSTKRTGNALSAKANEAKNEHP